MQMRYRRDVVEFFMQPGKPRFLGDLPPAIEYFDEVLRTPLFTATETDALVEWGKAAKPRWQKSMLILVNPKCCHPGFLSYQFPY